MSKIKNNIKEIQPAGRFKPTPSIVYRRRNTLMGSELKVLEARTTGQLISSDPTDLYVGPEIESGTSLESKAQTVIPNALPLPELY